MTCPGRPLSRGQWTCPDGLLVLRADAPQEDWLAARRLGIGSSDASAVVGVNKWTSAYEVWAEKRGLVPGFAGNEATELGHLLEPIVAGRWSATHGIPVRKAGLMRHKDRAWQQASVDRLAACGAVVEIKTLSWRVAHEWADGQTPDHAEIQAQHQMAVTGRDHAHVVGLSDGRTWLERVVVRDEDLIRDLTKVEGEFWHRNVLAGEEPEPDGSESATDVLNVRWAGVDDIRTTLPPELVYEYRLACEAADAAARHRDAVQNRIRAALGEATVGELPGGQEVTWRRNGTFASKRFATDHPDLYRRYLVDQTKQVLDQKTLRADHPEVFAAYRARVLRVPEPIEENSSGT